MSVSRQPADWHIRSHRQRVSLTAIGTWSDGTTARVLVSNMSYRGCHIWTDHELAPGETLKLALPDKGVIEGQIRWADASRAGVRFLTGDSAVDDRRARLGV
jgi:PilZ domain-containing protein